MTADQCCLRIWLQNSLLMLMSVLTVPGCTTGPGLWVCDVITAGLEGAACEIDCDTKYYDRSTDSDYAYQRCIFNCREKPVDTDKCTKAAKTNAE